MEGVDEVVDVLFADTFDAKAIDDQQELDGATFVLAQIQGMRNLIESCRHEVFVELEVGKLACIGEPIDGFVYFSTYETIEGMLL